MDTGGARTEVLAEALCPSRGTKKAFIQDGPGGGIGQMDQLQLLPRVLLGRVWPAERVVMGLRVCKWMHKELAAQVEKVLLVGFDTAVKACAVRQSFSLFLSSQVSLRWRGIRPPSLKRITRGLGAVLEGGARGWLVELELSVAPGHAGRIGDEGSTLMGKLGDCKALAHLD
eukprot:CAMPEP_0181304038 /NCGR_PEP_ID=MMETSP1101-20121128/8912_1 /TAXON_ID=46948 /ORGANISM="Rhodomonas abbreviata, Strain Caron Lab Isolate" /LENGTH=171 /DNA_ID=CAMNT_0023409719 /DNA_START=385 /DNA_END=897 /DNA_ORIENTATION=+